jgi:glycosyltransferase involved in cell wall biosynthesis
MEQTIVPRRIERELLAREHDDFPQWEPPPSQNVHLEEFCQREMAEWNLSDVIVCGSDFVRDGVARCGGPVERCRVVPYGVDCPELVSARRKAHSPIRVLVAGLGLRKGTPYVLNAARRLRGLAEFRLVGPCKMNRHALTLLEKSVHLVGPVPQSEMMDHYRWADVFLLPSLCEGSATVCYEALAAGLPVITTPNAGSVVRDQVDGFIVPVRDVETICDRIERLVQDPWLFGSMSLGAIDRARGFVLGKYGERLLEAFANSR